MFLHYTAHSLVAISLLELTKWLVDAHVARSFDLCLLSCASLAQRVLPATLAKA